MNGSLRQGFFFSSGRRHTILVSDWSSDVCSSDLQGFFQVASMSVRNFCLSASDRFCATVSWYTLDTSRSKYDRTPPVNSTAISAVEPAGPCTLDRKSVV